MKPPGQERRARDGIWEAGFEESSGRMINAYLPDVSFLTSITGVTEIPHRVPFLEGSALEASYFSSDPLVPWSGWLVHILKKRGDDAYDLHVALSFAEVREAFVGLLRYSQSPSFKPHSKSPENGKPMSPAT